MSVIPNPLPKYPGSKGGSGVWQQIINQLPPHRVYIEPFLGSGEILRRKRPAEITIGLDIDFNVVAAWESIGLGGCVLCGGALEFLRGYNFVGDEFVYCDPPYLRQERSYKDRLYACEIWTVEQHAELLTILVSLPCMVAISGYWSLQYAGMLHSWRAISYNAPCHGRVAVEWLWMNYPEPRELHDYRYLGRDYRERELVSKMRRNLLGKLRGLDALRRYAMLAALEEFRGDQNL